MFSGKLMALKADQGTRSSETNSIGKDGDFFGELITILQFKMYEFFYCIARRYYRSMFFVQS